MYSFMAQRLACLAHNRKGSGSIPLKAIQYISQHSSIGRASDCRVKKRRYLRVAGSIPAAEI